MSKVKHEIAVQERDSFGNNAARRYRKAGLIPVNVYSAKGGNHSYVINANEWEILSHDELHLVYLKSGKKSHPALVKEIQFNYLKNYVVHIDFQEVNMDEEVHSEIAVHSAGEAVGSSRGGVLEQVNHQIEVACKPADLPENLTVNISKLNVGEYILAKDIELPAKVKLVSDPEMIIFHVAALRVEAEETAAEGTAAEPELSGRKGKEEAAE